jgi:hypothetical protein
MKSPVALAVKYEFNKNVFEIPVGYSTSTALERGIILTTAI